MFDSLETLFAQSAPSALLCLLKAIGSREHIYVLNMAQDYVAMKAQEKAKKEQEGKPLTFLAILPKPNRASLAMGLCVFNLLPWYNNPSNGLK